MHKICIIYIFCLVRHHKRSKLTYVASMFTTHIARLKVHTWVRHLQELKKCNTQVCLLLCICNTLVVLLVKGQYILWTKMKRRLHHQCKWVIKNRKNKLQICFLYLILSFYYGKTDTGQFKKSVHSDIKTYLDEHKVSCLAEA